MRKQFLSFVLSFFLIANAFAQNIPLDPSVRTGTLSNGMKYYIKKNVKPEKKEKQRMDWFSKRVEFPADHLWLRSKFVSN